MLLPTRTLLLALFLSLLVTLPATAQKPNPTAASAPLRYRWVYLSQNLQVDANVTVVQALLRRAKAAGYNGAVLADYKLSVLDRVPENYFRNAAAIKETARTLGIDLYPAVMPVGYSNGLLAHDPNLAEGLPVRDALFVAGEGRADLAPDPTVRLANGDFEQAEGNKLAGWNLQDAPGAGTFADRAVRHGGAQSLRVENIGAANAPSGNGRVQQKIAVSPFRQYHLSVWVRTEEFETPGEVRTAILASAGRSLAYNNWRVERTQDWTRYHTVFNSLDNRELLVYLGVWGGRGGKLWWDDAEIEEIGLLNVLRRPGCPLTVRGEDGTAFAENRDFEPVRDERMGVVPWPGEYEVYHAPSAIRLTPNSRIRNGQRLRVSFYHAVTIYDGQVTCCLSEPKVYDLLADQARRVNALLVPPGFLMSHDEIRVANWCRACEARHQTPGALLADNTRRCAALLRKVNPKAAIFVWSDMYDPNHNAVDDYYLVNGTWAGSWEGLPKDAIVLNWHFGKRRESLPWFARRGHSQILAGYYDGAPGQIRTWLDDAKNVPGIVGVMYTTWASRYDDLEAFAQAAWGR